MKIGYLKVQGPPLALKRKLYPRKAKKWYKTRAKPLENLGDLANTVDERFVTTFLPSAHNQLTSNNTIPSTDNLLLELKRLIGEIKVKLQDSERLSNFPNGEAIVYWRSDNPCKKGNLENSPPQTFTVVLGPCLSTFQMLESNPF